MQMIKVLLLILFALLPACTDSEPKTETAPPAVAASGPAAEQAAGPFLVFFLDPNGGPCRMQNDILNRMADELDGKAELRYVQTTVPTDLNYFYAYGIRGLPALVLVDGEGREIKRLPPGVRSAEEIRQLLKSAAKQ